MAFGETNLCSKTEAVFFSCTAHALQFARPVVGAAAGLHADQAGRQIDEELCHLLATQLLLEHRLAKLIDAVDLEELFREVNSDGGGLHGERSFSGLT